MIQQNMNKNSTIIIDSNLNKNELIKDKIEQTIFFYKSKKDDDFKFYSNLLKNGITIANIRDAMGDEEAKKAGEYMIFHELI